MCNHPQCIYIDIIEMTNGEKLYIHYNTGLVPIFFQYYDEARKIDKEYVMRDDPHKEENIRFEIEEIDERHFIVYDGDIKIEPDEILH